MIRVTDIHGRAHLLHKDAISRVSEAGVSSAWHGVMAYISLFNGDVIEVRETPDQIAAQIVASEEN